MRVRFVVAASVALGLVVLLGLVLVAAGPAGDGQTAARESFGLEQARAFDEYPLFNAGSRVEGLPLTAVLRRDDTASYVSFVYGDCVAGGDAGCTPPAEIQVWPACQRNPTLYDAASPGSPLLDSVLLDRPLPERTVTRGVPASLFDGGTRLELQTGRSTVVVFGDSRARVLRIAAALRALDGSVRAGAKLPAPVADGIGGAMDC